MSRPNKSKREIDFLKSRNPENISKIVEECLTKFCSQKEAPYFKMLLTEMIKNGILPIDLLGKIPVSPLESGKTRFDQVYDGIMEIVFPGYRIETLKRFLGPSEPFNNRTRLWRALFPDKYKISHIFLRADSYQKAFAFACDYACRVSLRVFHTIPTDLTIRVMFVSERSLNRKLDIRWANRSLKRKTLRLQGRLHTRKEIAGARIMALGSPRQPDYQLVRYIERKDLDDLLRDKGTTRVSQVESEWYKK